MLSKFFIERYPSISNQNLNRYLNFISNCVSPKVGEYGENHHILPKSLFPEFKNIKKYPWNIKRLKARDHYMVHYMLCELLPDNPKILYAWNMLHINKYSKIDKYIIDSMSIEYEEVKKKISEYRRKFVYTKETREKMSRSAKVKVFSEEHKNNMKLAHTGKKHSKETKIKIGVKQRGVVRGPMLQETRDKISESLVGRKIPKEISDKIASKNRGTKRSEESKQKMREASKKRWTDEAREKFSNKKLELNKLKKSNLE